MTGFNGFPSDTFAFLTELGANNERDWFEDNKARYRSACLEPALGFIEVLAPYVAAFDPAHKAVPKLNGSFRRLNRDVRFSRDKSPYDPRLHLIFWTGVHPNRSPGLHLVIRGDGFGYGAGHWALTPDALQAYRVAMADASKRKSFEVALALAAAVDCTRGAPELKRVPPAVDPDTPEAAHLRYKSIVARTMDQKPVPKWISSSDTVPRTVVLMEALVPLNRWIDATLPI